MRTRRPDLTFLILFIVILAAAAGLTWLNREVIVRMGGNEVFAPIWEGARSATSRGENPYTDDAVARSRILLDDTTRPPRFLYPYFSLILFGPVSAISPYSLARAVWMTLTAVCMVGLAFIGLVLTRWRPGTAVMAIFLLFSLGNFHTLRAIFLGNPAVVVALLVAVGLLLVVREQYGLAGIFFGLSIIKPEMVVLLLPFALLWAVSQRQLGMVWTMMGTILILLGGSIYFFPQWILFNYLQFLAYLKESFPASPTAVIWRWLPGIGPGIIAILGIAMGVWLLVEWWQTFGKDSRWFLWAAGLTIVFTNLIGIPTSISNHALLLVPLALVFSTLVQRWKVAGVRLSVGIMVVLAGLEWLLAWQTMDADMTAVSSEAMLFFLPLATLALMYWVRYWALSSVRLKVDHLEALRRL